MDDCDSTGNSFGQKVENTSTFNLEVQIKENEDPKIIGHLPYL